MCTLDWRLRAFAFYFLLCIAIVIAGCSSSRDRNPQSPAWFQLPAGFSHYPASGNSSEPHYVVKSVSGLSPGRIVSMTYEVVGNGQLLAVDGGSPPTVSFIIWRSGDNLSCQGVMQQYRYFGHPRGSLSPGVRTLEVPIDPASWTDCYGKPGTDFPDRFDGAVRNAFRIGFGFGGNSAGHGVRAPQGGVQFKTHSFSIR